MIDRRRTLTLGLGALAATAVAATPAIAETGAATGAATGAPGEYLEPGKGPWTGGGMIRRAGGQLHYATLGTPNPAQPPVVLLHKLGGRMSDWRFVAPMLAKDRYVIAFDLPGHGESRWDGPAPYIQSLGETASLLVGALNEMGIATIDLIGTSLGGCVAVPLAAYYPERIHRLALVSSALGGSHTLAEIAKTVDAPQKAIFDANGIALPMPASLAEKTFGIINSGPIMAESNASRRRAGLWIQPSERGVGITDIKGLLKRVEAPTLLLYGARDPAYIKFRQGAEAALKTSRTEFVPNAGAFVMQDNPPATAAVLKRFLDQG
jgi:pimeloyl-ACP methyl ester carboxylesterase